MNYWMLTFIISIYILLAGVLYFAIQIRDHLKSIDEKTKRPRPWPSRPIPEELPITPTTAAATVELMNAESEE
jgi:hypothetical protein